MSQTTTVPAAGLADGAIQRRRQFAGKILRCLPIGSLLLASSMASATDYSCTAAIGGNETALAMPQLPSPAGAEAVFALSAKPRDTLRRRAKAEKQGDRKAGDRANDYNDVYDNAMAKADGGKFGPEKWQDLVQRSFDFGEFKSKSETIASDDVVYIWQQQYPRENPSPNFQRILDQHTARTDSEQCASDLTFAWREAFDALSDAAKGKMAAYVKDFLSDRAAFGQRHADYVPLVQSYVDTTRELLTRCYQPAEASSFVQERALLQQIGSIEADGGEGMCTALAVAPNLVVTARHCFERASAPETGAASFWFRMASSPDRYQMCSIAEPDALNAEKMKDLTSDQVVVRIAPLPAAPARVEFLPRESLMTMKDMSAGAPTLLADISYFPLASSILPEQFRSGFVRGKAEVCAASLKEDGCFSHICSAIGGGSGAPIFVANAPRLQLVGTHVGLSNSNDPVGACSNVTRMNAAVYPLDAVRNLSGTADFISSTQ